MLKTIFMNKWVVIAVCAILTIGFIYGAYTLKRNINYSFGYKSKVVETVCNMVKPEKHAEILKNPAVCK